MLVAVGDSITAYDDDVRDDPEVPYRPWGVWLAEALRLPCLLVAEPGATAPHVEAALLQRVPDGAQLGVLHIGVNDIRSPAWDAERYAAALDVVTLRLAAACARTVLLTVPLDLGRPPAGAKVADGNAIIADAATRSGADVCRLEDLAGAPCVQDDGVHLTATGQLEVARRVAAVLGAPEPGP